MYFLDTKISWMFMRSFIIFIETRFESYYLLTPILDTKISWVFMRSFIIFIETCFESCMQL